MMKKKSSLLYNSLEWKAHQYEQAKKAKRGHNYEYWSDEKWKKYEVAGRRIHAFVDSRNNTRCTQSEYTAMGAVSRYHDEGYYSRIIVGMCRNKQRIKMYSVIYRKK